MSELIKIIDKALVNLSHAWYELDEIQSNDKSVIAHNRLARGELDILASRLIEIKRLLGVEND